MCVFHPQQGAGGGKRGEESSRAPRRQSDSDTMMIIDHADDAIYLTTGRENAYLLNLARLPDPHPIAIRLGLDWLLGAVHKWWHHFWGVSVNFLPPITFTQKWCRELIPPSPDVTCYFWAAPPPPPSLLLPHPPQLMTSFMNNWRPIINIFCFLIWIKL